MENYFNHVFPIAKQNQFSVPLDGDFKIPVVCSKDIAAVAAYWLLYSDWQGQKGIPIHGYEDLSCNDIAAIFSSRLQKNITFKQVVSLEQFEQTILKHSNNNTDLATNLSNMYTEIGQDIYNAEPRTPESTTPTSFANWVDEVFKKKYKAVVNVYTKVYHPFTP